MTPKPSNKLIMKYFLIASLVLVSVVGCKEKPTSFQNEMDSLRKYGSLWHGKPIKGSWQHPVDTIYEPITRGGELYRIDSAWHRVMPDTNWFLAGISPTDKPTDGSHNTGLGSLPLIDDSIVVGHFQANPEYNYASNAHSFHITLTDSGAYFADSVPPGGMGVAQMMTPCRITCARYQIIILPLPKKEWEDGTIIMAGKLSDSQLENIFVTGITNLPLPRPRHFKKPTAHPLKSGMIDNSDSASLSIGTVYFTSPNSVHKLPPGIPPTPEQDIQAEGAPDEWTRDDSVKGIRIIKWCNGAYTTDPLQYSYQYDTVPIPGWRKIMLNEGKYKDRGLISIEDGESVPGGVFHAGAPGDVRIDSIKNNKIKTTHDQ